MTIGRSHLQALLLLLFALPAFDATSSVQAQSIFERRSPNQIDQYSTYSARRRGDSLSILINENTDVENRDERSLDKSGRADVDGAVTYGLGGGLGAAAGSATYDQSTSSERNFRGDSEFRSERQFMDRFMVVVVDVLPNGNLLVSGERNILVHGDERTLKLSGIVRQFDLLANNTVPSNLVANLRIELNGKGPEQSFENQGWFGKHLNRIWPF